MDWFPPEPTLDWVRWQLDRLVDMRLMSDPPAGVAADYDLLCALERSLLEEQDLIEPSKLPSAAPLPPGAAGGAGRPLGDCLRGRPRRSSSSVLTLDHEV